MTAPAVVEELVERFESHREAYRSGKYNETQLRRDFLDPFFKALGCGIKEEAVVLSPNCQAARPAERAESGEETC